MKTTKHGNTEKLTLPFPHFLWMIGISAGAIKGKTVLHEPKAEQENVYKFGISHTQAKQQTS